MWRLFFAIAFVFTLPAIAWGLCGGISDPCCPPDDSCTGVNVACINGFCTPCGSAGKDCCDGNTCSSFNLTCSAGTCVPCGASTEPCCSAGNACGFNLQCIAGVCTPCGLAGEDCCGNTCSSFNLTCSAGTCVRCGGSTEPCCSAGNACGFNLLCVAGVCTPCGLAGEDCCEGNTCSNLSLVCNTATGKCECGGAGQPACPTPTAVPQPVPAFLPMNGRLGELLSGGLVGLLLLVLGVRALRQRI